MSTLDIGRQIARAFYASDDELHETVWEKNADKTKLRVRCTCGYRSRWVEDMNTYIERRDRHLATARRG